MKNSVTKLGQDGRTGWTGNRTCGHSTQYIWPDKTLNWCWHHQTVVKRADLARGPTKHGFPSADRTSQASLPNDLHIVQCKLSVTRCQMPTHVRHSPYKLPLKFTKLRSDGRIDWTGNRTYGRPSQHIWLDKTLNQWWHHQTVVERADSACGPTKHGFPRVCCTSQTSLPNDLHSVQCKPDVTRCPMPTHARHSRYICKPDVARCPMPTHASHSAYMLPLKFSTQKVKQWRFEH